MRDLIQHLGGVQRWATSIVATPRTEPWNVDLPEVVGTWPDDEALTAWLQDGADTLARTLETADPALQCWAFLKATSPLAMWARRQAHETAIHRVDGESALGASGTPFDPSFGADGVDELLMCFVPRRKTKLTSPEPRVLRVTAVDADGDWDVVVGASGSRRMSGGTEPRRRDGARRGVRPLPGAVEPSGRRRPSTSPATRRSSRCSSTRSTSPGADGRALRCGHAHPPDRAVGHRAPGDARRDGRRVVPPARRRGQRGRRHRHARGVDDGRRPGGRDGQPSASSPTSRSASTCSRPCRGRSRPASRP